MTSANPFYAPTARDLAQLSEPSIDRLTAAVAQLTGVLERHRETWDKGQLLRFVSPSGGTVGALLAVSAGSTNGFNAFYAWTLWIDNPSGYILRDRGSRRLIPANAFNYPLVLVTACSRVDLEIAGGADTVVNEVTVTGIEAKLFRW